MYIELSSLIYWLFKNGQSESFEIGSKYDRLNLALKSMNESLNSTGKSGHLPYIFC